MPQDEDGDDPRAVERRRVEYLRRHREQTQQRYRLEAERRGEELEADAAAMRARRDEVQAAKAAERDKNAGGNASTLTASLKPIARSVPGIYARFDDLGEEELQLLANRYQKSISETQLNPRGKYHARYMKDAYPIAGSQLKLEREHQMEIAAKKKLLLTDASSRIGGKSCIYGENDGGVLSLGLERAYGRSKLDHYVGKLATALKGQQEQVQRTEGERRIRLCEVQHREGLEQFWKLMHAAPKREVIAWLKLHSFLDVNTPVRLVSSDSTYEIVVCEDRTLGVTPLMAACRSLCVELVRCLLGHGAVVWLATANGDTALHFLWRDWALGATGTMEDVATLMLRSQHLQDILADLIAQGVDVNAQNAFGETALQFSARYGLQDCAKMLLVHGADAFTRDRKRRSAVQYAQDNNYESLHQLLLHYNTVERVRAREKERHETTALLNQKRGALAAEHIFTKLKVEQERAGHLRNQYVDCRGQVIVCPDEDE
ncbi:hypothetical protein PHYPSEUDO_000098 [Phytophthora pseudosyringae]|uniref:Uncharacterized protein n=1 Tax=Phytophthora pseudosyringae TaxID=221518 RepID=A0A8T1WL58_9STRA|nr:hypothetical protein PHYPSEUDO_000098 [Phytophthora pseudosyringae]